MSPLQILLAAMGLWCFVTFILLVVSLGAVMGFAWWFVSTPIRALIALARRAMP